MEECINDIRLWMASNFLKLNDSKTEVLILGSKHMLNNMPGLSLHIGDDVIQPSEAVRNIGAMFDETLSMKQHISMICKGAWHHLRLINQIRPYLDTDSCKTLMHSFVSSRLDSFNSLLYGVSKKELTRLQRIQNAAARIICGAKKSDNITPILKQLHWLPVIKRIEYKIILLTYKALNNMAPDYISSLLHRVSYDDRQLRSCDNLSLIVPRSFSCTY